MIDARGSDGVAVIQPEGGSPLFGPFLPRRCSTFVSVMSCKAAAAPPNGRGSE
jgi:hypothetical protein